MTTLATAVARVRVLSLILLSSMLKVLALMLEQLWITAKNTGDWSCSRSELGELEPTEPLITRPQV